MNLKPSEVIWCQLGLRKHTSNSLTLSLPKISAIQISDNLSKPSYHPTHGEYVFVLFCVMSLAWPVDMLILMHGGLPISAGKKGVSFYALCRRYCIKT